jgi:Calpain family cysteine protease
MPIDDLRFRKAAQLIMLEGTTTPGASIHVENASAAPMNATWASDKFSAAVADENGQFHVVVPAGIEGDKLRVRANQGVWQLVSVSVGGTDNRRAEFNPQGLRLVERSPGIYGVESVSANQQASEPGTVVQLFNMRDRRGGRFALDADGHFPAGFQVPGQPGDVLALACSDGVHNVDFQDPCGFLVVPPPPGAPGDGRVFEPGLLPGDPATMVRVKGPLFVDRPRASDAVQGEDLGDCYLVSTAAALAQACPKKLKSLIQDNADGTSTVTFKRFDAALQRYVPEPVTVTHTLPADDEGRMRYGRGPDGPAGKTPLWFPLLEKAYAAWKGGYTAIINGFPYEVFEALLGKAGTHFDVRSTDPDELFAAISTALKQHQPIVSWTTVDSAELPFSGSRLAPDHAYAVLGVSEQGGERTVTVRNPYGHEQPAQGPDDRGVTKLPWKTFLAYSVGVGTVIP